MPLTSFNLCFDTKYLETSVLGAVLAVPTHSVVGSSCILCRVQPPLNAFGCAIATILGSRSHLAVYTVWNSFESREVQSNMSTRDPKVPTPDPKREKHKRQQQYNKESI
eukprot:3455094-Amphidinium_carterae.1